MTGNIVYESFSTQGLFINICALYWQRDGILSIAEINKRYKNPSELSDLKEHFFTVENDLISIKFLDEQLIDANHISKVNSQNGSLGGRPKKSETKPTALRPISESKAKLSKEKKSKEEVNKRKEKNNIPAWIEFLTYGLEKEPSVDHSALKNKYDAWIANDWKDGNDRVIVNWKSKLLQTMPYINKTNGNKPKVDSPY